MSDYYKQAYEAIRVRYDRIKEAYTVLRETTDKIEDPRKRDHQEPDDYTRLGCVMNMASEANKEADKILGDTNVKREHSTVI